MASVKQNAPKNRNLIVGIVLVAVIFVATLMVYTVDVTEYAVVTQFGDPVDEILPVVKLYIVDSSDGRVDVKLFDSTISGIG